MHVPRPFFFFLGTTVASRCATECYSPPSPAAVLGFCLDVWNEDKNDSVRFAATAYRVVSLASGSRLFPALLGRAFRKLRDPVIWPALSSCRGI